MSSISDEENSIASGHHSSPMIETVDSLEADSLPPTPTVPHFLSRPSRRFSGFITPLRETLRPIFQLAESPIHDAVPTHGDSYHSENLQAHYPNSNLPTITPGSQHSPTLYSQDPVDSHLSMLQETLPTNQQQDNLVAQTELDWSLNQSNLDFFNTCMVSTAPPVPLSFVCKQVPEGLGLSSNCQIWLDKLKIKNWDEFVHVAGNQTIEGLMSLLSASIYSQHREDLRYFLIFGFTLGQDCVTYHPKNACLWMPRYILNLCTYLPKFPEYENNVIRRLHAEFHPPHNTPSHLLSYIPPRYGYSYPLVNPTSSHPIRHRTPPLEIPRIDNLHTAILHSYHPSNFGGGVVMEHRMNVMLMN